MISSPWHGDYRTAAQLRCHNKGKCLQKVVLHVFWLLNVKLPVLSIPARNVNSGSSAYLFPLIWDNTKLQVINPLTFGVQSSRRTGIWTEKSFMLAWAVYMQRRAKVLCQESRISAFTFPCCNDLKDGLQKKNKGK